VPVEAVNVLIAFYSRNGSTEALANAIAEGARSEGAEVVLRRAREVVGREIMQRAPGWIENADRMNARYQAPTEADAERADAIVFGSPTRFGAVTSELKAYIDSLRTSYGDEIAGTGPSVFTYGYYTAGRALVKGLEAVSGDIADQAKLQEALADVTLSGEEAPWGDVELDENRQAISDVYVKKIVADKSGDGVPDVQTFRKISDVDQTFGGFFSPDSPEVSRNDPKCEKSDSPPPWVGNAEEVSFGK